MAYLELFSVVGVEAFNPITNEMISTMYQAHSVVIFIGRRDAFVMPQVWVNFQV